MLLPQFIFRKECPVMCLSHDVIYAWESGQSVICTFNDGLNRFTEIT